MFAAENQGVCSNINGLFTSDKPKKTQDLMQKEGGGSDFPCKEQIIITAQNWFKGLESEPSYEVVLLVLKISTVCSICRAGTVNVMFFKCMKQVSVTFED